MSLINDFKPEFLGSDPNMLRELAYLKNKGLGEDISPRYVLSGESMLDQYTRKYVEYAFQAKVLDSYGTTEAGPLAFECLEGEYHVNSDFVYLEFLDEEKQPVQTGESGRLVVSRLYGNGTPIIRYTGIEDVVTPLEPRRCRYGLTTEMIKHIEGRSADLIILPDGQMLSPFSLTGVPAGVMADYNTYKIKQFQIIQHAIDDVEVLVVIDESLRSVGPEVRVIINEVKKRFQERLGGVNVKVTEVDSIQRDDRADYVKVCISKVKKPF